MSQDWYRKMLSDSADLIKNSYENQLNNMDFSQFMANSQPAPHINSNYSISALHSIEDTEILAFNSLPNALDFDFTDCSREDNPFIISNSHPNSGIFTPDLSAQNNTSNVFNTSSVNQCSSVLNTSPVRYGTSVPASPEILFTSKGTSSRGRKYQNTNLLALFCQQILCQTAHPNLNQLDSVVSKLKCANINAIPDKKMRSSVREWFRKRREYMATKIYRSCQRLLPNKPESHEAVNKMIKQIHKNSALLGIIMLEAKLPMQAESEKLDFVKEKIVDFYMKYPQRRMRNSNGFKVNKHEGDDLSQEVGEYEGIEILDRQFIDEDEISFY